MVSVVNPTRVWLVIILFIYLFALGTFLNYYGATYNSIAIDFGYSATSTSNQQSQAKLCDCGTITCNEYKLIYGHLPTNCGVSQSIAGNIATSISILPSFLNILFVVFPALLLIFLIATFFIPTLNLGG